MTGVFETAWNHLCSDLNTPAALGACFTALKDLERDPDFSVVALKGQLEAFGSFCYALGLQLFEAPQVQLEAAPEAILSLAKARWEAKQARDFTTADALRAELAAAGWVVKDSKDAYTLQPA